MHVVKIPKRNGEYRTIYVPSADERIVLNIRLQIIKRVAEATNIQGGGLQHGFQPAHSPTTNALQHINFEYTLTMDLKDFFDSVTPEMVPEDIRFPECFPDGAARQGLPTSPALANIAASKMDAEIYSTLPQSNHSPTRIFGMFEQGAGHVAYTRYADDLTFSSNSFDRIKALMVLVPRIAERHGFTVKASKTKIQWAGAGRRMITGIAVDSKLHTPRSTKRRLRAAKHQRHTAEARGLAEWMMMRIPAKYNAAIWTRKPTTPTTTTIQTKTTAQVPEGASRIFQFPNENI